jgi:heme exporter protein D
VNFFTWAAMAFIFWTSYGLAFIVLLANFIMPLKQEQMLLRTINRKLRRKRSDKVQ